MKTSIKVIHWAPRILCILSILFISIFAADSLQHGTTIWQKLVNLSMHLIPTFILTVLLIVALKWEYVGGMLFIIIGVASSPFIFMINYYRNHFSVSQCIGIMLIVNFPFVLVGILFIISHYMKRKQTNPS